MPFDPDAYLAEKTAQQAAPAAFDPDRYLSEKGAPEEPGILSAIGNSAKDYALAIGKKVDSYTGAPVRKGIGALQEGKSLDQALGAGYQQIGENPETAPTGKEIATRAGLDDKRAMSDRFPWLYTDTPEEGNKFFRMKLAKGGILDPTPAGAAGLGIDVAADPVNLIAPGAKALTMGKEALQATKAGRMAVRAAEIPVNAVKSRIGAGAAKLGEGLTGIPANELKTYATNLDEINKKIGKYGADTASAADDVRAGYASSIKNTRQSLNKQISEALASSNPKAKIDIDPVIAALDRAKRQLNPTLEMEQIQQVDDLMKNVHALAPEGKLNVKDAFDLKQFLQDKAAPAYMKSGQIFQPGKAAQQAAKSGASEARKMVNTAAPEIEQANNKLSLLHALEKRMNKNLIAEGKPDAALMAAGAGTNSRNVKNLRALGDLTGTDMVGQAEKLAAQRTFSNPGLLPADTTGKSFTRMAAGGVLGSKMLGPLGAPLGMLASSPTVAKGAINAGVKTGRFMTSPVGKAAYMGGEAATRQSSPQDRQAQLMTRVQGTQFEPVLQKAAQRGPESFAASQYLLSQKYPEFRSMLNQEEEEGDEQ